MAKEYVRWFDTLGSEDVAVVGGKNSSLGEMIRSLKDKGINVPDGFATTSEAYWSFLEANRIKEKISDHLDAMMGGEQSLSATGSAIRKLIRDGEFPEEIAEAICKDYRELSRRYEREDVDVAVRSSATAEDLPEASFAGQQETFLNVTGERELLEAVRNCFASLFTNRAISYREEHKFDHMSVALSAGVQKMVRSDRASSGVMFSLDTETGFREVVVINAAWGLGENVVQGTVTPDEYRVFKPLVRKERFVPIIEKIVGEKEKKMVYATGGTKKTVNLDTPKGERTSLVLTDPEILTLAKWAVQIEEHYGKPMDIEWAKDGDDGSISIVQARPETVQTRKEAGTLKSYRLKEQGERILEGVGIGEAIATGKAIVIKTADEIDRFEQGSILVTGMTDPDWVPIMKQAQGIITDFGGRTSHAAIVSRELGIPAIVGTGHGTDVLKDGQEITLSCAEGDTGYIYQGKLDFEVKDLNLEEIPRTMTKIMMNIATPAAAFRWWRLPCHGIGLARMEFIINTAIKIHPMALVNYPNLKDPKAMRTIDRLTQGYEDKPLYFVDHLALGIAKIAASQHPEPVIVRMSDFKTNEYADLIGGQEFEPRENNPMLGFRGASRYYSDKYRAGFALECRAIRKVREVMGFENVVMMIPFCRTIEEADKVLQVMAEEGLKRGERGLQVYVMAEIPSNVILAEQFAERFDGFSIGSNDLTQLVLGVDRDSEELAQIFDERNEAVKRFISDLIHRAHAKGTKVGICGQAPSDYPEFAAFLVREGIDSISLNPDSVVKVMQRVAEVEAELRKEGGAVTRNPRA
jgi:pyruvate, water dikinase